MVKGTAGQQFLLTTICFEHCIILVSYSNPAEHVLLFTLNIIILAQLWVSGKGPTIEGSYLPRKIVREKRLSFRGHRDCILLYQQWSHVSQVGVGETKKSVPPYGGT